MRIFAGIRWTRVLNESGVVENGNFRFFRSLYLTKFQIQGRHYYIVISRPLLAFQ